MVRVTRKTGWLIAGAVALCAVLCLLGFAGYSHWTSLTPRFHDDFGRQPFEVPREAGWQAYGGAWEVAEGAMQNVSDDRGAKLINGNSAWRDYMVESDVQLLSETGDAGFVLRTSDEEVGVDAYHGYFAGLRDLDDTLIIGRADFGWHEFRAVAVHSRIHTRAWYHLQVIAQGCDIAAAARSPEGELTVASVHDPDCIAHGRFGLQSYSTGALWRNVTVRPAGAEDMAALLQGATPRNPDPPPVDAAGLPLRPALSDLDYYERSFAPMQRQLRDNHADLHAVPIASLRLLAPNVTPRVTLHGVVTLVAPVLFVQDSSGGIAIPDAHSVIPVQIGDAVEATGDAELHSFSSVLKNATVRLLWSHTQVPPVAVTASQAATGSFDAQFVETEGRLASAENRTDGSVMLQLDEGNQSFVATAGTAIRMAALPPLTVGSRLRIRGICVTSKNFTKDQVPFALLLRSPGDVQVLAPPPWWNKKHIAELGILMLALVFATQVLYTSIQRARFRAVMEERERIAMEMHDTLAQSFAGLGFQLEAMCGEAERESAMHAQLESTLSLVRYGHMQARRNISALRPINLDRVDLIAAMGEAARLIVRGTQIKVELTSRGVSRSLPLSVSDVLFRIAQETVANAVRHARPATIRIRLTYRRKFVILTIQDDGRGFQPTADSAGLGIRSMRQRAQRISAAFRIFSSPQRGTIVAVRARLPRQLPVVPVLMQRKSRSKSLHR